MVDLRKKRKAVHFHERNANKKPRSKGEGGGTEVSAAKIKEASLEKCLKRIHRLEEKVEEHDLLIAILQDDLAPAKQLREGAELSDKEAKLSDTDSERTFSNPMVHNKRGDSPKNRRKVGLSKQLKKRNVHPRNPFADENNFVPPQDASDRLKDPPRVDLPKSGGGQQAPSKPSGKEIQIDGKENR
jgi:hypothetical protein